MICSCTRAVWWDAVWNKYILADFMVVQVPGVRLSSSACGSESFSKCLVYSLTDHWNSSYRWKRAARPGKPQSQPTTAHREMERMILVLNYWCFLYFLDVVIDVTVTLYPRLKKNVWKWLHGSLECINSDRKMSNVIVWVIIWFLESLLPTALVRVLLRVRL